MRKASSGTATLFAIPAFLLLYFAAVLAWQAPTWPALVDGGASIVTFAAYALDKHAARRGRSRTRESTLHALSLAGGWPGALVAQQMLRHKSVKPQFRNVFWATVILNVAVFVALSSPAFR